MKINWRIFATRFTKQFTNENLFVISKIFFFYFSDGKLCTIYSLNKIVEHALFVRNNLLKTSIEIEKNFTNKKIEAEAKVGMQNALVFLSPNNKSNVGNIFEFQRFDCAICPFIS